MVPQKILNNASLKTIQAAGAGKREHYLGEPEPGHSYLQSRSGRESGLMRAHALQPGTGN
eukprot:1149737-Pelagomonas_calceolata.AAC.1